MPKLWCDRNRISHGITAAVDLAFAALKLVFANMEIITKTIPEGWKNAAYHLDCQLADLG
ncbi:hypothetical protein OAU31_02730 [Alphaproteobacteria bacterium]|nr:hypothetical protein [Alphaproteobacteria bacterium]